MINRRYFTPILIPLSWAYHAGLTLDRLQKSRASVRLARPVLSVGNLTVGGTGKTPILIKLAHDLVEMGVKPAILTRGYQGVAEFPTSGIVDGAATTDRDITWSDEVQLMARDLPGVPIGVGSNRARMAAELLNGRAINGFLLDDGFQHWKLKREIDVICLDVTDPFGGGHLIPWGRLREPVEGLSRARFVVLTRTELRTAEEVAEIKRQVQDRAPSVTVIESRFQLHPLSWKTKEEHSPESFRGKTVLAVSALGNPGAFEKNLIQLGMTVIPVRFLDHSRFFDGEVKRIEKLAKERKAEICFTEKDAVKLKNTRWGDPAQSPGNAFVWRQSVIFSGPHLNQWNRLLHEFKNISLSA